jgi:hypothetical protein
MAKRTSSKSASARRAGAKVADALDNHERVRLNSPDPSDLRHADSELSRSVEDSRNEEEAVTEYLEEEKR